MKNKKNSEAFHRIASGLEEAIAWTRGKKALTVREVELKSPAPMGAKDVARVRAKLRVSQAAFAKILNVSPKTVQAWERDARRPSDAALKLLHVAERHPEVLMEA